MTRVKCWCGIEGTLEIRGNSKRILHYKGFINGKRVYEKHRYIDSQTDSQMGVIEVGVNKPELTLDSRNKAGGVGFGPTTTGLGGLRPIRPRLR